MTASPTTPHAEPDAESTVDRFGPWVALFAAIGLTASGEYALAQLIGFPAWIAWAFPVAVDVYVVQAIRRHRDVAGAIALMIATNGLYHLADAGLLGVDHSGHPLWWLIVGVVAVAPMIVWRVHRITEAVTPATEADATEVPLNDSTTRPGADLATTGQAPTADKTIPRIAAEPDLFLSPVAAPKSPVVADSTTPTGDSGTRQEVPGVPAPAAITPPKTTPVRRTTTPRVRSAKKAPRRSLTEWVDLAGPVFHAEFAQLRRQPTANEFATAIAAAGLGQVSDSTAKNIRTEILDRTDVPALD